VILEEAYSWTLIKDCLKIAHAFGRARDSEDSLDISLALEVRSTASDDDWYFAARIVSTLLLLFRTAPAPAPPKVITTSTHPHT
jgi:hypothetical protein